MYSRKIGHSRVKNIFKFASSKMGTVYTVESALEFDTCFHLEYSPTIKSFEAQPFGFKYNFGEKSLPYTPDFRIENNQSQEQFIEVKPLAKTYCEDFRARFIQRKIAAEKQGVGLILVTEEQIRVNPILNNFKLLHRYTGFQSITPMQLTLLKLVQRLGLTSIKEVSLRLKLPLGELLANLLSLICRGMKSKKGTRIKILLINNELLNKLDRKRLAFDN